MTEIIKEWVITNFGLSALILIAMVGLGVYAGGWLMKFKKELQNLPCNDHDQTMKKISERLEANDHTMRRIESKLDRQPCADHAAALSRHDSRIDESNALLHRIESKLDRQPCADHAAALSRHDSRIDESNALLHRIEGQLDGLNRTMQLLATTGQLGAGFTQSHSPISLTDKGAAVAEEIRLPEIIRANWATISSIINEETNPYDIQMKFLTEFVFRGENLLDAESLDRIKRDAFLRGVPLTDYMRMAAVMARDLYFSTHGISPSEADSPARPADSPARPADSPARPTDSPARPTDE